MKHFLKALLPSYWIMLNRYSKAWDTKLNDLIKTHNFVNITKWTADIGGITVWIENQPYSAFTPYKNFQIRPSRRTVSKAIEKLEKDFVNHLGK